MIAITVYKDTIKSHDEVDNLAEVYVTEDFAKKYFDECKTEFHDMTFDEWYWEVYTADNTEDFYEYAKEHNAIIKVKDLTDEDIFG